MGVVIEFPNGDEPLVDTADSAPDYPETVSMIEHVTECNRLELEISRLRDVIVNMAMHGFETLPGNSA